MWNRKKCMRTRIHSGALSVVLLTVLALQPYYIYAENDKTDESDPIELYVSPEGSDEGQGTIDEPLATVSAARDMLRKLKNNIRLYRKRLFISEKAFTYRKIHWNLALRTPEARIFLLHTKRTMVRLPS